jgi:putative ABC transport system substrate-binding protein
MQDLTPQSSFRYYWAFFEELRRLGYIEGQNLVVERFTAEGRTEHYPELVRNVVRTNPDVIFAITTRMVLDLIAVTTAIPIICITPDPIATGLVANLARPGGNVTGVSNDAGLEIWAKRLQLLREAVPGISRLGLIGSRAWSNSVAGAAVRDAVKEAGISLVGPSLRTTLSRAGISPCFYSDGGEPRRRAHRERGSRKPDEPGSDRRAGGTNATAGTLHISRARRKPGLMAYGHDILDAFRHIAQQIDRILKGTRPADIPFFQSSRFELVIKDRQGARHHDPDVAARER